MSSTYTKLIKFVDTSFFNQEIGNLLPRSTYCVDASGLLTVELDDLLISHIAKVDVIEVELDDQLVASGLVSWTSGVHVMVDSTGDVWLRNP